MLLKGWCGHPIGLKHDKVFAVDLALRALEDRVFERVGREPSGDPFNSVVDLERTGGIPRKTNTLLDRVLLMGYLEELHEFNPMLGFRGCRIAIAYPESAEMQARAIFEAALNAKARGTAVVPEIMVPLVGTIRELDQQAAVIRRVAEQVFDPTSALAQSRSRVYDGLNRLV